MAKRNPQPPERHAALSLINDWARQVDHPCRLLALVVKAHQRLKNQSVTNKEEVIRVVFVTAPQRARGELPVPNGPGRKPEQGHTLFATWIQKVGGGSWSDDRLAREFLAECVSLDLERITKSMPLKSLPNDPGGLEQAGTSKRRFKKGPVRQRIDELKEQAWDLYVLVRDTQGGVFTEGQKTQLEALRVEINELDAEARGKVVDESTSPTLEAVWRSFDLQAWWVYVLSKGIGPSGLIFQEPLAEFSLHALAQEEDPADLVEEAFNTYLLVASPSWLNVCSIMEDVQMKFPDAGHEHWCERAEAKLAKLKLSEQDKAQVVCEDLLLVNMLRARLQLDPVVLVEREEQK